jgi:hypothetical protein
MTAPISQRQCYLVEWYRPALTQELFDDVVARLGERVTSMCAEGAPVHLLMAIAVPGDELVFGVFEAGSEQVVAQVCDRAGFPAQRLSQAMDARAARQPWGNT